MEPQNNVEQAAVVNNQPVLNVKKEPIILTIIFKFFGALFIISPFFVGPAMFITVSLGAIGGSGSTGEARAASTILNGTLIFCIISFILGLGYWKFKRWVIILAPVSIAILITSILIGPNLAMYGYSLLAILSFLLVISIVYRSYLKK